MAISRNPVEYLRRKGLVTEPARPKPRLDISALLVHTIPLATPKPVEHVLRQLEGDAPADHGLTQPWPGQFEE